MPTPNNTVSLLIAGKTHSQWTDYDIDSDLLTPADDFQVTLGRPVDAKPDAVQPGDTVEVRVGEDTVCGLHRRSYRRRSGRGADVLRAGVLR